jgi:hypothetical protein
MATQRVVGVSIARSPGQYQARSPAAPWTMMTGEANGGADAVRAIRTTLLAMLALVAAEPGRLAAEWAVKPEGPSGCVLESAPESLADGYQTTSARIRVDAKKVMVSSPSVFDASFDDIGVVVDDDALIPIDRLGDPRTAVFESRYGTLVEQFKRGARARVQLRFWPTWPATGTHSVTFSLIGFTRAYAQLGDCK